MEHYTPLLLEKDNVFKKILDLYGMPGFPSRPQGFESMCKTILEQQVSLNSARASYNKLDAYMEAFGPANILKLSDDEFRLCGISRQKAVYLRALAEAVIDKTIDFSSFAHKSPQQARQELIQVKGIGKLDNRCILNV
jgi:DNA-3-methyladenine glycosylase II